MKTFTKLSILLSFVCLFGSTATAQKKRRVKTSRKAPAVICQAASVPAGMVIVGYKPNNNCAPRLEAVVKRAENGDIICADSPVPGGFSIFARAEGTLAKTCSSGAVLIVEKSMPVGNGMTPETLEARCDAEVQRDIDNSVAHNLSEKLAVASASATRLICMKRGAQ